MYAYVKDNAVIKIINGGAWNDPDTGVQHPANIFSLWSKSKLAEIGLYPIEVAIRPNSDFNRIGSSSYSFDAENNKVVETINSKELSLSDTTTTVDGTEYTEKGLKSNWIEKTKATAKSLLEPTDWYVVRNAEDNTQAIPSEVTTHRASVRTASNTIETAITNASDMTAFKALFVVPTDSDGNPTGKAPIYDFPEPYGE
jgi:hypothetical protein